MLNLNILRPGMRSPQVELLQLALKRAGYAPGDTDGIFGSATLSALTAFQSASGIAADGTVGKDTWNALMPYLVGYVMHTVRPGDTLYRLAARYKTTVRAIEAANPIINALDLRVGSRIVIPLGFSVVPDSISFTSTVMELCVLGLRARYPFLYVGTVGTSVMGKSLYSLVLGRGENPVFYNASHHANEWITSTLLMKFIENYCAAYAFGTEIFGTDARMLFDTATLYSIPLVNPDGVDLVAGELMSGPYYENALSISADYPEVPFPEGWKANIIGTDLNLQYPAGWEDAREIKYAQGWRSPAPRDFVGEYPLSAPESRAVYDFTRAHDFSLTLSYHTQGGVIFWKYLDIEPEGSREIAEKFSQVSGYEVSDVPYASGFAGYKDWFIYEYNRPGFTIEAGRGTSPVPISQFPEIYRDNEGILVLGLTATTES